MPVHRTAEFQILAHVGMGRIGELTSPLADGAALGEHVKAALGLRAVMVAAPQRPGRPLRKVLRWTSAAAFRYCAWRCQCCVPDKLKWTWVPKQRCSPSC